MKILVTGAAGFIGFHLVQQLSNLGMEVVGVDSINDYYDVNLKNGRLKVAGIDVKAIDNKVAITSSKYPNYRFMKLNVADKEAVEQLFKQEKFDKVCHLAAQAGVRYSLENPYAYVESNLVGFVNVLEACRNYSIKHLIYASSSSVYGSNNPTPYSTNANTDYPISLYAATKKSNELMAHTYSHLYQLPTTGLRFFTVYGPWGRPDMAYFIFTKKLLNGEAIDIYNEGNMSRDFTYIDDIVEGVNRIITQPMKLDEAKTPYKVYNIGNNDPVRLLDFISCIEQALGVIATKNFLPLQPGDMLATWANVDDLIKDYAYKPSTDLQTGIDAFVNWYRKFYNITNPKPIYTKV